MKATAIDQIYLASLVVHCKRAPYDVYIGRPSKWGNPFSIGPDGNREEVIQKYKEWFWNQPQLVEALPELTGKILGCWCAPLACHGHFLAQLANVYGLRVILCNVKGLANLRSALRNE
jgi:hypothetical protein